MIVTVQSVPEGDIPQLTSDYAILGGKLIKKTKTTDGTYDLQYDVPDNTRLMSAEHADTLGATTSPSGSVATAPAAGDGEARGLDMAVDASDVAGQIAAAGLSFVARYYRRPSSSMPPLSLVEAKALAAQGLQIVTVWEGRSDVASHFSFATGVDEGTSAYMQAAAVGQPAGTPIYFAVDYDASQAEAAGSVTDYFAGVAKGFATVSRDNPIYAIGVYGSGRTCRVLLANQAATFAWLAMSTGWAEYKTFGGWHIKQGPRSSVITVDHDVDTGRGNFGAFTIA